VGELLGLSDAALSLWVLVVVIALFVWNRLPGEVVSVGAAVLLYAVGLLGIDEAFAGFGDPVVVFVASLFVVSEAIDATGITSWAGERLIQVVGDNRKKLATLLMLVGALLAALISPNGAVAALLPMAVALATRTEQSPSRLAMPLAFAATTGSLLVLTGTPVNLLISNAAASTSGSGFGFFEFALVGVPCLVGTVGFVLWLGPRTLSPRTAKGRRGDFSDHASTLIEQYAIEGALYRLKVRPRSPWVGLQQGKLDLGDYPGLTLIAVESGDELRQRAEAELSVGDILVVQGSSASIGRLVVDQVLAVTLARRPGESTESLLSRELGVVEIVIPPRSRFIGDVVYPGRRASQGDHIVLAVQRRGRDMGPEKIVLAVGDSLLIQGTWESLARASEDHDVLVVDSPDLVRRQAVPLGRGARRTLVIVGGMVLLLALDVVPAAMAVVLAVFALIVTRVVRVEQAYRAISWTTVLLVAGLFPLSKVLQETGAAALMARALVSFTAGLGPLALLAGLFVLVNALCQFLGTMATALIVLPVALSAASEVGASARPFLMAITIATAAAFLTPFATSVNMMVTGPGGYRFGDFWKLGLAIVAWFFLVTLLIVPRVWPF
jgi:di/tricarboxylate transporter